LGGVGGNVPGFEGETLAEESNIMGRPALIDDDSILKVVFGLKDYWPLTIRQVYYRLVVECIIRNATNYYKAVCRKLTPLREDEIIPWEAIEDRSRRLSYKRGATNLGDYLQNTIIPMIKGYERCYVQGQEKFVEIWVEKDALASIFSRIAYRYCVRVLPCRGYNSITHINKFLQRADKAIMQGQRPVILYFGDLDPTGWDIFESYKRKIWGKYERNEVELHRIALNYNQVMELKLPLSPEECKASDPRYKKFVKKYGEMAVELDAIHPAQLQDIFKTALESHLDMTEFGEQEEIEWLELSHINRKLDDVQEVLANLLLT
jgi:hypothetical protein